MIVTVLVPCPADHSVRPGRWPFTSPAYPAERAFYHLVAATAPPTDADGQVWFAGVRRDRRPGHAVCFRGVPFVLAVSRDGSWIYNRPGRLRDVNWEYTT